MYIIWIYADTSNKALSRMDNKASAVLDILDVHNSEKVSSAIESEISFASTWDSKF